jgi:hypothetical protein
MLREKERCCSMNWLFRGKTISQEFSFEIDFWKVPPDLTAGDL